MVEEQGHVGWFDRGFDRRFGACRPVPGRENLYPRGVRSVGRGRFDHRPSQVN